MVPVDATLESLSSPLTHAAAHNKPSRFRTSNKHLESASLIIPSILSSDPSLTNSHTMLGPATRHSEALHDKQEEEFLEEEEEERMRRTLEAIVEGRPLPKDEQEREMEKEIKLREEYKRRRKGEEDRTSGKTPPVVVVKGTTQVKEAVRIEVPKNLERVEVGEKERGEVPGTASGETAAGIVVEEKDESIIIEEKPKKMSR